MSRERSARFTVLLASDGSRQAHASLAFAAAVPWAGTATAHTVLARGGIPIGPWPAGIWVAGMSDALTGLSSVRYRGRAALCAIAGLT